jgi:hypothetical protein
MDTLPPFIPGLELCKSFYDQAIKPILQSHFARLDHSAALLNFGSDVLGFDTPRSRDHGWGPRCQIFLKEADFDLLHEQISRVLGENLPFEFRGYPTNFHDNTMQATRTRPINHWVWITTANRFFQEHLGVNPANPIPDLDWLLIPPQRLRLIAAGGIFQDGLHELEPARKVLAWYPRDVWLYQIAAQWRRIAQEEPFMARCGEAGDELGSRLVAARMAWETMRLCFLLERQYPPYAKWFGTAFSRLKCSPELSPMLRLAMHGDDWRQREAGLSDAYLAVSRMHNSIGLTEPVEPAITAFHARPYRVPIADRFAYAAHAAIQSPEIKRWPKYAGAVWQFADSTDVFESIDLCRRLAEIYGRN